MLELTGREFDDESAAEDIVDVLSLDIILELSAIDDDRPDDSSVLEEVVILGVVSKLEEVVG